MMDGFPCHTTFTTIAMSSWLCPVLGELAGDDSESKSDR
jgi:hypothetical protein